MTDIPVIETERLRLRPHRADDFQDMQALWGDPRTVRFIGGQPLDDQAVWFRMLRYAGLWPLLGYGYWAVEDRQGGAYLGDAGLANFRRGLAFLNGMPEIGWVLSPVAAGRGLATEAVARITAWADKKLGAPVTRCIIDPANAPSLRVAEKAGYQPIGRNMLGGVEILVLERLRF